MLKERKKKILEDYYWKNKQIFEVCSIEVMDGIHDTFLSIYTVKDGHLGDYLFDVRNYSSFWDLELNVSGGIYSTFDVVGASCSIYYDVTQNLFTIHRFGNITQEDILKCTKYLMRNYYDSLMFNYRWTEPKEDEKFNFKENRIKKFFNRILNKI